MLVIMALFVGLIISISPVSYTHLLLGLILAIGIVVDDAIVVVEGVEHIMETEHLSQMCIRDRIRSLMKSI